MSGLPLPLPTTLNVCISNVRGPKETLYWRGARLEATYPVSIPGHSMALNITAHSVRRGTSTSASSATGRRCRTSSASPCTPARRWTSSRRRCQPCADPVPMLTIQGMPNRSVSMPNSSPHICFSSGIVTVPPSDSLSQ